ncbi:DUF5959 family protein [Streptomyces marianii]|uniref:DUF5959 family protein n=1 Tax=Streptomyces marianii TaxID=1817406 RepID=UPI001F46CAEA|nr:DUF5959 family protein [Streptomyces marianii]
MTESAIIRLDDGVQSVAVRVLSREEGNYYDAEIVIESDSSTPPSGRDSTPTTSGHGVRYWSAVEEDEYDEEDDSVFAGDWPQEGRTAYPAFVADDPYVVEVRDAPSTQICVRVPLDLDGDRITEARERHAAARQALGM